MSDLLSRKNFKAFRINEVGGEIAADFETLFARELSAMSADDRRDVTDAAASLLTWATWESLRAHQGLSITRAMRVMTRTLRAIVGKNF